MDATQLTLLLNSRFHASAKTAPSADDAAAAQSKAFAAMLQQHDANRAEEQKRLELNRQHQDRQSSDRPNPDRQTIDRASWRNASAPIDHSRADRPASSADTGTSSANHMETADKTASATRSSSTKPTSPNDANSGNETSVPRKVATQHEKTDTKSAGKLTKSVDGQAHGATDDAAAGAEATAAGNIVITKQDVTLPQLPQGGDGMPGDGGNGQAGDQEKDGTQANGASDDGKTAAAEAVEATILASLVMPQPPATGAGAAIAAAAGIPVAPTTGDKSALGATDGTGADASAAGSAVVSAAIAQGNAAQAAQALAALTVPGSTGTTAATPTLPNTSQGATLPQAPALPAAALSSVADAETSFTNVIAKKLETAQPAQDNLHITATRSQPDNSAQLPRPLVKVDDTKPLQASVQPAAQSETVAATTSETAIAPAGDQSDYFGDTLHAYSPFSALMPGGLATAAAKQADALTALRQQLASASVQDQVAVHMQRAIRDSVDKISIQLSPSELGHIHVKMNVDDDKQVSATITVERPATLELLQRDTKALERALQEAGLKADSGSLSFSLQRGNQGDSSDTPGWGQGGRQIGSSGQEKAAAASEASSGVRGNEIDTANGLVNVAV